jgi:hypothetical protein
MQGHGLAKKEAKQQVIKIKIIQEVGKNPTLLFNEITKGFCCFYH